MGFTLNELNERQRLPERQLNELKERIERAERTRLNFDKL